MKKGEFINIEGCRFGKLTAICRIEKQGARSKWLCKCDCGNETVVSVSNLRNGHTKSCGCLLSEFCISQHKTHGGANKDRLYTIWRAMRQRCYRPQNPAFKWYGALGVTVCDEWNNSYEAFRSWAYANGYDKTAERGKCTIDRINCAGNYEPSNCRWVNMSEQARNKRRNK